MSTRATSRVPATTALSASTPNTVMLDHHESAGEAITGECTPSSILPTNPKCRNHAGRKKLATQSAITAASANPDGNHENAKRIVGRANRQPATENVSTR